MTIKRFDFSSAISTMICLCARHAVTSDGATQQALDEIAANLNTVAAIVNRRRLSPLLDGPIPPVPAPHLVGQEDETEENDDDETLSLDEPAPQPKAKQPTEADLRAATRSVFPALATVSHLTPSQTVILDYIRANPGCTGAEISAATGYSMASVHTYITVIRRKTPIHGTRIGNNKGTSNYRICT